MPIKKSEDWKTLGWYVACPYCKGDSLEWPEPIQEGKRITCPKCKKVFISGGRE
jgi:ssDNA-binding Zn-finger/Zn-ribbon topoisomerase 1